MQQDIKNLEKKITRLEGRIAGNSTAHESPESPLSLLGNFEFEEGQNKDPKVFFRRGILSPRRYCVPLDILSDDSGYREEVSFTEIQRD